ncbi:hypothetical protein REPUB_Repub19eG0134700 [Reevesia pubescens]
MLCWGIWNSRNDSLHKSIQRAPNEIVHSSASLLEEFRKALTPSGATKSVPGLSSVWLPPTRDNVKINFDAAIFNERNAIGIGVVIRNSKGEVLALCSSKIQGISDPFVAECSALSEALTFAKEIGFNKVEVEGDSMLTVSTVKRTQVDHSIADDIIESIKEQSTSFINFSIRHVRRTGNTVAYTLAKHSLNVEGFQVWLEEVPNFLAESIMYDSYNFQSSSIKNSLVPT